MKCFHLGRDARTGTPVEICSEHLDRMMFVTGSIGSGKSRFLWQLMREHRRNRRGFLLIDPGDLAPDFLADVARERLRTGNPALWKKVHYLCLSPFGMARWDPMKFRPHKAIHPELLATAFRAWQHCKARTLAEAFQGSSQGDSSFEGMPRLERWLTNVFTAVSTLVDGNRLSVGDAEILIDLGHPLHARTYERLRGRLPRTVQADFEQLHAFRRPQDVETATSSTVNRLRSTLGPLMAQMFGDPSEPSFDPYEVIQRGDYAIVSIAPSLYSSAAQGIVLARLVFQAFVEAALTTPRDKRREFTIIWDECQEGATPEVPRAMRVCRKYKCGIVLGAPGLRGLQRKDHDLAADILEAAETLVAFRSKWPEDAESLARLLRTGDLDFTKLEDERFEHQGEYDWIEIVQTTEGTSTTDTRTVADGVTATHTEGSTSTETNSTQHGTATNWTEAEGSAATSNKSKAEGRDAQNKLSNRNTSEQGGSSSNRSSAQGGSATDTAGHAVSNGETASDAVGRSQTVTQGGAVGKTEAVSRRPQPMPRLVRVRRDTGALETAVADQLERFRQELSGQGRREATLKTPASTHAVLLETEEVKDPFDSVTAQVKAVDWALREIMAAHDYYFVPDGEEGVDTEIEADEPVIVDDDEDDDGGWPT